MLLLTQNHIMSPVFGMLAVVTGVEIVNVCVLPLQHTPKNATKRAFLLDGDQLDRVVCNILDNKE